MCDNNFNMEEIETTLEAQPHGGALKRKKKELIPIDESTTLESQSLDEEAAKVLSEQDNATLKTIAKAVGKDGLSLQEACVIANVDFENFKRKAEEFPVILKIVRMKETEYKHMLLRALAVKARSGDDKMAMWLLERRYPEEFGSSKSRGDAGGDGDLLGMAISFIQESGDRDTLVRKQVVVKGVKKVSGSSEIKQLQSFLN